MLKYVVFALFVASTYGAHIRIVNGTDAKDGEFPFATVLLRSGSLTCGSTIINERFILTAAHCACDGPTPLSASLFSIQYGLTTRTNDNTNVIKAKAITCNKFNEDLLIFDSAIVELVSAIPNDGSWEPVKLSKTFDTSKEQEGVVIGWGRLSQGGPLPDTLQKINVVVYDDNLCGQNFDNNHHICFGTDSYGGACNGDSGTALLVNGVQVGIASFITDTCGIANKLHPNVYSRVATYYDWIQSVAGTVTIV